MNVPTPKHQQQLQKTAPKQTTANHVHIGSDTSTDHDDDDNNLEFFFYMIDQDAKEQPDTWVLLDNQSMIDAFLYKALLKNIHDSVSSLEIKSLRTNFQKCPRLFLPSIKRSRLCTGMSHSLFADERYRNCREQAKASMYRLHLLFVKLIPNKFRWKT